MPIADTATLELSDTAALAAAVESAFTNPLDSKADAYREAVNYVRALPEASGNPRVDSHRAWFLSRMDLLESVSLRQSERDYIHGKCAHAALEIGFYRGDLSYDWRH
ncbi:hypothetical protein Achl_4453 (plasmid) [Pseudarthrobacter chlorophenolicus A6]|uniref:Uncharacterized protein n=1 Tax=Pseudarthrobacter chlorophenolicus (strain ATCC 700700 / DSM 12829 / CIP 107037 / JCM 12360 / KCTC 9906 / NCIMB 13794 / A6) TaxID=452863 RepID=B8HJ07_PSECP|nr:hypothetical protein [Pseudarthrobacter chlorophenolicus]ACL42404.1 hypothetical protein Achl_4453 [Pseudarthrobacter chlorophenolicus A6]SDQ17671.1 hypothetical protein SAMN04489738_0510 [Pseudarthrobacter chlorophenolicus]